jgi:beta-lactamase regulating signal transducer with metallopeptidase domain
MSAGFVPAVLSNAACSLVLAFVALGAGAVLRRPQLAYLLWLLVLFKLFTPPVLSAALLPAAPGCATYATAPAAVSAPGQPLAAPALGPAPAPFAAGPTLRVGAAPATGPSLQPVLLLAQRLVPLLWALCTLVLGVVSLVRILRFSRHLAAEAVLAPPALQALSAEVAQSYGLRWAPAVYETAARLAPLVWRLRGQAAVVVPAALATRLRPEQWRWVLAHELAHIKRRDDLVRWLEWLAGVCFFWNPVVWWAQRNLRAAEELCCDAMVLASQQAPAHAYAKALWHVVDALAVKERRPPLLASSITGGQILLSRCKMIVNGNATRPSAWWMQTLVLIFCVIALPWGARLHAQDGTQAAVQEARTGAATADDKLSPEQQAAELRKYMAELEADIQSGKYTPEEAEMFRMAYRDSLELLSGGGPGITETQVASGTAERTAPAGLETAASLKLLQEQLKAGAGSLPAYDELLGAELEHYARLSISAQQRYLELLRSSLAQLVQSGELSQAQADFRLAAARNDLQHKLGQDPTGLLTKLVLLMGDVSEETDAATGEDAPAAADEDAPAALAAP